LSYLISCIEFNNEYKWEQFIKFGEIEDKIASPENVVDDAKVSDLNSGTIKNSLIVEGNKLMLEIENGIISELYVYQSTDLEEC
jgi:hypothetical protein